MVKHVLMFKFKDEISQEEREEFEKGFMAVENKIECIVKQEIHHNFNKHQDYDLLCTIDFNNREDYDKYDVDENHRCFARKTKPLLDKISCVDYMY